MKIEIGESLIRSWLRHVKSCQIVQLNWKPSRRWQDFDAAALDRVMQSAASYFAEKLEVSLFGKTASCSQLMQQAEIDVLGIALSSDGNHSLFAVDTAFHEGGLNYGGKAKTAGRVVKKVVRTAMSVRGYFPDVKAEIVFATPKVTKATFKPLRDAFDVVETFFSNEGLQADVRLIVNEDFERQILNPVCAAIHEIADTSELFLRSLQLERMFQNRRRTTPAVPFAGDMTQDEPKIGELVRTRMRELFASGKLSNECLNTLQSGDLCKQVFGLNYPMLREVRTDKPEESRLVNGYPRYWKEVFGDHFLLCNDWYERNRDAFLSWYQTVVDPSNESE